MSRQDHIVFVDDCAADVELAQLQLTSAGVIHTTARVCTEHELLSELGQRMPDLIVSDFSMPGFDGLAALGICLRISPQVPFLFHSGTLGEQRCRTALQRGAYGCIVKEDIQAFVRMARHALGRRTRSRSSHNLLNVLDEDIESFRSSTGRLPTLIRLGREHLSTLRRAHVQCHDALGRCTYREIPIEEVKEAWHIGIR